MISVKTYKEEYRELIMWLEERLNESKKLPDDGIGFDAGQRAQQEMKDGKEYRRRLRELEAKHGVKLEDVDLRKSA